MAPSDAQSGGSSSKRRKLSQRASSASSDRTPGMLSERDSFMVVLDVEGTVTPEAWLMLQQKTGIEELKLTTAHEPNYDKLMKYRCDVLRKHNIKLKDMMDIVNQMEPLPGAVDFLEWLKPIVPRIVLLTDTFEEYAMPLFEKLGFPTVFCNSLIIDEEGFIAGHKLRLKDQKRKAVEAFQRMNFRVISVGDSFNDVTMLRAAERGILYCPSEQVVKAHPDMPIVWSHADLKKRIGRIIGTNKRLMPRELVPVLPMEHPEVVAAMNGRQMWIVMCNLASTMAPEPWPAIAEKTGIEELKQTTRAQSGSEGASTATNEAAFAQLMQRRADILRKNNVKLHHIVSIVEQLEPLPHAKEFMDWLKPICPRSVLVTDGFEEYALPMFDRLRHPMVFCNFLDADEDGFLNKFIVRCQNQKAVAVEEFQRLSFKVLAIGSSFNDMEMLRRADKGVLFAPAAELRRQLSDLPPAGGVEIPVARDVGALKALILQTLKDGK